VEVVVVAVCTGLLLLEGDRRLGAFVLVDGAGDANSSVLGGRPRVGGAGPCANRADDVDGRASCGRTSSGTVAMPLALVPKCQPGSACTDIRAARHRIPSTVRPIYH